MATALGHSIIGLVAGRLVGADISRHRWRWYVFAAIAANAADLDFLPGLLVGDINRYHQQISHSLIAACAFAFLVAVVAWRYERAPMKMGVLGGVAYSSHLLLDWLTYDARAPYGIPLLWPFSKDHFIAPVMPFGGVRHGVPGEGFMAVIADVFSWHNLGALVIESAILLPVMLIVWYFFPVRTHN